MDVSEFTIGDYKFDSFHEYRDGQEDLKKIEVINAELDVQDPQVAVRLYNLIRKGEISFKTEIGDDFSAHIADIVAEKSQGFIEEEADTDEVVSKIHYQRMVGIGAAVLAVALFVLVGIREVSDLYQTRRMANLQITVGKDEKSESSSSETGDGPGYQRKSGENSAGFKTDATETDPFVHDTSIDPSTLTVLPEYAEAFSQNSDMVGWLEIPDTVINYPVMQMADDNEFYLNHDFEKRDNSAGTLFVDYRSDVVNPTTNTIIYGHNMKNDSMFGSIDNYLDEEYYNNHKTVNFDTIYEKRKYEVVAVCLAEVAYQDENNYRYYNFIQAANQAEWEAFVGNVNSLSVYDGDVELEPSDKVLTLSTCNNYTEDGRLFLVCKRVE